MPLLPERQKLLTERYMTMRTNFDGPEARPLAERCLLTFRLELGAADAAGALTERFTRVAADKINYRVTIDDPVTFTQPWSAEYPFYATSQPIYEYACHEGNYALPGILAGAREDENRKLQANAPPGGK